MEEGLKRGRDRDNRDVFAPQSVNENEERGDYSLKNEE